MKTLNRKPYKFTNRKPLFQGSENESVKSNNNLKEWLQALVFAGLFLAIILIQMYLL